MIHVKSLADRSMTVVLQNVLVVHMICSARYQDTSRAHCNEKIARRNLQVLICEKTNIEGTSACACLKVHLVQGPCMHVAR